MIRPRLGRTPAPLVEQEKSRLLNKLHPLAIHAEKNAAPQRMKIGSERV